RDPRAVLLREGMRLPQRAARRHRQHDLARRGMNAQRVAPRLTVAAQPHRIDDLLELNLDRRRFGRTAIKESAQSHENHPPGVLARRECAHIPLRAATAAQRSRQAEAALRAWPLRARELSFERTKSAMRGAISARKREPLNTP